MTFIGESSFDLRPFMFLELVRQKDFVLDLDLDEMQGDIHQESSFKLLALAFMDLVLHNFFIRYLD